MKRELTVWPNFNPEYVLEVLRTTSPDLLNQTEELRRVLDEACYAIIIQRAELEAALKWYRDAPGLLKEAH